MIMDENGKKHRLSPLVDLPKENCQPIAKHHKMCHEIHSSSTGSNQISSGLDDEMCENLMVDFDDDWDDLCSDQVEKLLTLDLTTWTRCKIVSTDRSENNVLTVTLMGKRCEERAVLHLLPPWNAHENITSGNNVSVIAVKSKRNPEHFEINADHGFLTTDPDVLVSGTTVVGALFCQRRGVFQELFRMFEAGSTQMHVGTIAHSVFQQCLLSSDCDSLEAVRSIAQQIIKSSKTVASLYEMNMNFNEMFSLLDPYIKEIDMFLKNYVHFKEPRASSLESGKQPTSGISICKINDIEENIWCHHLGIKGRIDATVSVNTGSSSEVEVMPLELKTGRASYSFEHIGQLALYEMMMNLVGHHVNGGLLVYLREGKCSRMSANRNMKRDLIILRNEIASHLSNWMVMHEDRDHKVKETIPMLPKLPGPINNGRACLKCSYNTVCGTFFKHENRADLPVNHDFSPLADSTCSHLSNGDMDYFIRWTGLIYLEQQHSTDANVVRTLWTQTPDERSRNGRCIAGLTLITPVRRVHESYFHTFSFEQLPDSHPTNDAKVQANAAALEGFQIGEYVICSTDERIAVGSGHIISWVNCELVVSLERDLTDNYANKTFHLDHTAPYKSTGFCLSNLAMLLADTEEATTYRRIIVGQEKPSFVDGILSKAMLPVAKEILKNLNRHQKQAALRAAATNSYCLLKGLPGTGKTQTIVGLIRLLSALGLSVLLTSNTHSAVDNVLRRLLDYEGVKFIRLGSLDRVDPDIKPFAESVLTENCDSPEKLAELYDQFKIVAVTCQGTGHPLIGRRIFDYCIADEATQIFQPAIIRPLLRCKRFLLVGDPEQLPPVVKSVKARTLGAAESLFHRLDQEGSYCILPTQYRMNRVLTNLANAFTYDGKLVCGNDVIANSTLRFPHLHELRQTYEMEKWLMKTVSNQIDLSVVFVDTGNTYSQNMNHLRNAAAAKDIGEKSYAKCANISEVALVAYVCRALVCAGVKNKEIGIIAPFRAQVELIRTHLGNVFRKQKTQPRPLKETHLFNKESNGSVWNGDCNIEVNTVDQFQGRDKKAIIYSCTKSVNPEDEVLVDQNSKEILSDKRRLTVAITRAQEKLIVIGDRSSLISYVPFKKLFEVVSKSSNVQVTDKRDGFEWSNVFDSLISLPD